MINSNILQCVPSPTFTYNPKSHFAYLVECHSMDKVMGKCGNMLSITRPSMKGGNNMLVGIIASFIFLHIVTHQD
jgi:hypothetical protein